ncbi:MAG: hypothetical protein U0263_10600 [Polyangiaceae bacterium]
MSESGPEYVYSVSLTQPGTLTVSVQDDVGVDIDVHLYTSKNTNDCVARHDTSFTKSLDCGTYLVVADTFSKNGSPLPGAYTLTVGFTPAAGQSCGAGPKKYAFEGGPGDACAYPGNKSLPFCNPNLGVDTCLYTSSSSFCSKPCSAVGDCGAFPGGCCADIGSGDHYCLPASQCGGSKPDSGVTPKPDAGGDPDASVGGAAGSAGAAGAAGSAGAPAAGAGGGGSTASGGSSGSAPDAGLGASAGAPTQAGSGDSSGCSTGGAPGDGRSLFTLVLALFAWRRGRERS